MNPEEIPDTVADEVEAAILSCVKAGVDMANQYFEQHEINAKAFYPERIDILDVWRFEMPSEASHALSVIRSASQNFDSVSKWMQQWAAWGMEPNRWPQPSPTPPEYASDKERILQKLTAWRDAEALRAESEKDVDNESAWESYIDAINKAIRLVESA